MPEDPQQEEVIEQLEKLNEETAKGNSLKQHFVVGIVYGVGFVVGSAIIATALIGLFGPYLIRIPVVHGVFEAGYGVLHPQNPAP